MKCQAVFPTNGSVCFADEKFPGALPAGLAPGARLDVLGVNERQRGIVRARDESGKEWALSHWQVDAGYIYEVEGQWMAPHDERVRPLLLARLAEAESENESIASTQRDGKALLRQTLRRWG